MKETLLPLFNKLPQSFRELDFLKQARRYLGILLALLIAGLLGLTLAELFFACLVLVAILYLCYYLTKPETPEVVVTDPASPPAAG